MSFELPKSNLIDLAIALGWNAGPSWRTEVAWKKMVHEYPTVAATAYLNLMGIDLKDQIQHMLVTQPEQLCDCYIEDALARTPYHERGELYKDVFEQQAEAFIWNERKSILMESLQAEVTRYIATISDQSWPDSSETPKTTDQWLADFAVHLVESTRDTATLYTCILVSANKRGIEDRGECCAYSINEALRALDYAPGGIENHWEHAIDDGIVGAEDEFDAEHPEFNAYCLKRSRCFYGLEDDEDPAEYGNFVDGDSNSAYKLFVLSPEGTVHCYPK